MEERARHQGLEPGQAPALQPIEKPGSGEIAQGCQGPQGGQQEQGRTPSPRPANQPPDGETDRQPVENDRQGLQTGIVPGAAEVGTV